MYFLIMFFAFFASGALFGMESAGGASSSSADFCVDDGFITAGRRKPSKITEKSIIKPVAVLSALKLLYDKRTIEWFENPESAYVQNTKENLYINQPKSERILRHQLPTIFESRYLPYMIIGSKTPTEIRAYMPGSLIINGNELRGFYEISWNPIDKIIVHRCFKSPTADQRTTYPKAVVDADRLASTRLVPINKATTINLDPEERVIATENIFVPRKKRGVRLEEEVWKAPRIVREYKSTLVLSEKRDFPLAEIDIVDIAKPEVVFALHTGYFPASGKLPEAAE